MLFVRSRQTGTGNIMRAKKDSGVDDEGGKVRRGLAGTCRITCITRCCLATAVAELNASNVLC
jgi:hypothetical protein